MPTDLNRCRFNNNSDTLTKYLENLNIWEYFDKEQDLKLGSVQLLHQLVLGYRWTKIF